MRDRAILRQLAEVATEIADTAYSPMGRDASQVLDEAESKVFEIAEQGARGKQGFQEMPPLLTQVVERIDMLYNRENPNDITGRADRLRRSRPHDLRPAAGRSGHRGGPAVAWARPALAMNIAEHVALERVCRSACSAWRWRARSW